MCAAIAAHDPGNGHAHGSSARVPYRCTDAVFTALSVVLPSVCLAACSVEYPLGTLPAPPCSQNTRGSICFVWRSIQQHIPEEMYQHSFHGGYDSWGPWGACCYSSGKGVCRLSFESQQPAVTVLIPAVRVTASNAVILISTLGFCCHFLHPDAAGSCAGLVATAMLCACSVALVECYTARVSPLSTCSKQLCFPDCRNASCC